MFIAEPMLMGSEPNSWEFEKRAPNSFKASAPSGFIDYYNAFCRDMR
jgi:hypothetical protein